MKLALPKTRVRVLLFSAFVISVVGLSYELLIGSLSTNLEGNPVLQYSLTIGFFMSALGLGAYLSRFFSGDLLYQFIVIEIILGILGGVSVSLLNFVYIELYPVYMLASLIYLLLIGTLVGLEIPLLIRILKRTGELKETISNVLTIDYLGGLAASLIFPLLLYPYAGLIKTSFILGVLNVLVGIMNLAVFRRELSGKRKISLLTFSTAGVALLLCGTLYSSWLTGFFSRAVYGAVLFEKRTRFQKIILTRYRGDTQLYLNGYLQFSGAHEYRYHEGLVFPPFYLKDGIRDVLVLGGGDGLAVKQVLKFPQVRRVVLVDLDPDMTDLAKNFSALTALNGNSLNSPKVQVINQDAYVYLKRDGPRFDVIYADFPDPHDAVISKLYSREFYFLVRKRLRTNGIFLTQASSPLHARLAFWCIGKTLLSVFSETLPYRLNVPNLGDWGFFMAFAGGGKTKDRKREIRENAERRIGVVPHDFFSRDVFLSSLVFPRDSRLKSHEKVKVNLFMEPILYRYYSGAWKYE